MFFAGSVFVVDKKYLRSLRKFGNLYANNDGIHPAVNGLKIYKEVIALQIDKVNRGVYFQPSRRRYRK